ncbi:MAG: hypothetical protein HFE77_07770 [Clostridiales bacterium]|nr:hypothetical protein [Clostridiales bacterium]
MGFGLLLIGYALTFCGAYHGVDIPPAFIAYGVMLAAFYQLGRYGKQLRNAGYFMLALTVIGCFKFVLQLTGLGAQFGLLTIVIVVEACVLFAFYVFFLVGIKELAFEVELPKLAGKAIRNLWIVAFFYGFTLFSNLYVKEMIPSAVFLPAGSVFAVQQMAGYLLRALIFVHIGSCYRRICLEGDEDMPEKPSVLRRNKHKNQQ